MKQLKNLTALAAVILCALIISCNDNFPSNSKVSFKIAGISDQEEGATTAGEAPREFNEAFLGVTELEFLPAGTTAGRVAGGGHGNHDGDGHHDKDKDKDKDEDDDEGDEDDDEDDEEEDDEGSDENEDDGEDGDSDEGEDGENDPSDGNDDGQSDEDAGDPVQTPRNTILFKGPFIVDLLNGNSIPDFGVAEVMPATYQKIRLKLGPALPRGKSIFISATLVSGISREAMLIEFSLASIFELRIENPNGFKLEGGDFKQFIVLLDLDTLFEGVDLREAVADEHGIVRIDEESNAALAAQLRTRLSQSIHAREDSN
jgi:hypothetical protein